MSDPVMEEFEPDQRRAVCLTQAEYIEARARSFRVAFYKQGKKKRRGYEVDVVEGSMQAVSLIQLGEARGHGIYVDGLSLGSALEVLAQGNLPAFITHNGALVEDRMLKQVGFFSGFYIDEGKLKAEKFRALESFRDDETESFNRLFDLAKEMPDAFGLSLVFEADLVWVFEDGKELLIKDSDGEGAIRDIPSVRFNSISSADFVDEPAANEDGLFSKPKSRTAMEDEPKTDEEVKLALPDPDEDEEEKPTTEEETEEAPEAEEEAEEEKEEGEEELAALREKVAALEAQIAELAEKLLSSEAEKEKLSAQLDGEEVALATNFSESDAQDENQIRDAFLSSEGGDQTRIWKQNKRIILQSLRRS